jgi:hypothetical protein
MPRFPGDGRTCPRPSDRARSYDVVILAARCMRGLLSPEPRILARSGTAKPWKLTWVVGFGTKRPPCSLRARWVGRVRGFTVTDGATEVRADLRRDWSGPSAALIPKLIVLGRTVLIWLRGA